MKKLEIKMSLCFLPLSLIFSSLFVFSSAEIQLIDRHPQVETSNGFIQGKFLQSRNNRTYAVFEGIPYAKPASRFQAPEPAGNWTGVKNTSSPGSICPQFETVNQQFYVEENCLFLNVYVPMNGTKPVANLTTMVWIHGGGFLFGAGSFMGAKYFTSEDVILVTFNYRLGSLGFLHTGDDGVSTGNFGLKDMILALKWVNQNKGRFVNEPGNTTIFGESAGSAAVHALVLSPAAKGLFAKAILQSGTMFSPWALQLNPTEISQTLAKELNCSISNSTAMVECFKQKTVLELLQAEQKLSASGSFLFFVPSIDGKTKIKNSDFSVLPETPYNLIAKGGNESSLDVPLIIGVNEKEGLMTALAVLLNVNGTANFNENWDEIMTNYLSLKNRRDKRKSDAEILSSVRSFYFNGKKISNETQANFTNLYTDFSFYEGARRAIHLHAKTGAKIYPYVLTFPGKFSLVNFLGLPTQGVSHADDLQYFFDNTQTPVQNWPDLEPKSKEETFSVNIIKTWTSFSRTGVPSIWTAGNWEPLNPSENSTTPINFLELKENPKNWTETPDVLNRTEFWATVFTADSGNSGSFTTFSIWIFFVPIFVILQSKMY